MFAPRNNGPALVGLPPTRIQSLHFKYLQINKIKLHEQKIMEIKALKQ